MAEIKSIGMENGTIEIKLSIDKVEYGILKNHTDDLIVLPCGSEALVHKLTTGKLGNSNRIMLPKKVLRLSDIKLMDKKVASNIFNLKDGSYLLVKIRKSDLGIPKFEGDE